MSANAIENATAQFHAVTGKGARQREEAYVRRSTGPTATKIRDAVTGREGFQVDMFGLYLVIRFTDGETVLREMDDVTVIESRWTRP